VQVHSDQIVLRTVRQEARPQVGTPGSCPLRLDGSHDDSREAGPSESWPKGLKGELENNSREPKNLVRKLA
jgi:hypothetical protein